MQPLISSVLVSFSSQFYNGETAQYLSKVHSTLRLKLNEMKAFKQVEGFTFCRCGVVLTTMDPLVRVDEKEGIQQTPDSVVWICKYCATRNYLREGSIYVAGNESKMVLSRMTEQKMELPVVVLVFDTSGSMQERPFKKFKSKAWDQIKHTSIYQKLLSQDTDYITRLIQIDQVNGKDGDYSRKFKDRPTKLKIVGGMTQFLLNGYKQESRLQRKIAIISFDSHVRLHTTPKIVRISNQDIFGDFDELFAAGQSHGLSYEETLQDFDFSKLETEEWLKESAQTALGPALIIALGVASKHGPGSTVILITDGCANKGIFSSQNCEDFRKLNEKLSALHVCLTIFECRSSSIPEENSFTDFVCPRISSNNVHRLQMKGDEHPECILQDLAEKLRGILSRELTASANSIRVRSQHPLVTYDATESSLTELLLSKDSLVFISPTVQYEKLQERDYLFPFCTQAIIRYQDFYSKEQSIFMCYLEQKFVRCEEPVALATSSSMMEYFEYQDRQCSKGSAQLSESQKELRSSFGSFEETVLAPFGGRGVYHL